VNSKAGIKFRQLYRGLFMINFKAIEGQKKLRSEFSDVERLKTLIDFARFVRSKYFNNKILVSYLKSTFKPNFDFELDKENNIKVIERKY